MLVLSRKYGEVVYILNEESGEVVTLTVCDIRSGKVQIGLDGSKNYKFIRKELYDRTRDIKTTSIPVVEEVVVDRKVHFHATDE